MTKPSNVYKITCKINSKIYIGKANDPKKRWSRHKNPDKKKIYYLQAAIIKHGAENFSMEVIEKYDSEKEAYAGEKYYIKLLNAKDKTIGYNLTDGGIGSFGRICSDAERLKKSVGMTEYWKKNIHPSKGKKYTEEEYKTIFSKETRRKISDKNSGSGNGMYDKTHSFDKRKEMSIKMIESKSKTDNIYKPFSAEVIEQIKKASREGKSGLVPDDQKDIIIELYNTGSYTKKDLGIKFNLEEVTIKHIIRKWPKIRANNPKYLTLEQKTEIIEAYLSNKYTDQQIVDKLQITLIVLNRVLMAYKKESKV
jgi:group I intron endonuclease